MASTRKSSEVCGTCWYAGKTAGYQKAGRSKKPLVLCRRRHELHPVDDFCPKYMQENKGVRKRD